MSSRVMGLMGFIGRRRGGRWGGCRMGRGGDWTSLMGWVWRRMGMRNESMDDGYGWLDDETLITLVR